MGDSALGLQDERTEQRAKQERTQQWLHSQTPQADSESERQVHSAAEWWRGKLGVDIGVLLHTHIDLHQMTYFHCD